MSGAASEASDTDDGSIVRLSEADANVMLDAVDGAFQHTLRGRYGGGVLLVLKRGGDTISEQALRQVPVGLDDAIMLELTLRGRGGAVAPGFSNASATSVTALGTVTMLPAPARGAGDVHVSTEVFDDHDPNGAADDGCLTTGVLLSDEPQGLAGQMPGRGVYVVRTGDAQQAAGAHARPGQRGWMPRSTRNKVSRAGGLGSNGHCRAAVPQLTVPVSRALLKHIGDHVATAQTIGGKIERLVVGLRAGHPAPS